MATQASKIPPLRIVLSGGGIRGVAHTGALLALKQAGMLKSVKEFCGVSAGGLIAFCLCIGYTVEQIRSLCIQFDFGQMRSLDPEDIFSFFEAYGLDSGERIKRLFESLLKQKGLSPSITFAELATTSPYRLRLFASDLMTIKAREFSEAKTPSVSVVTALLASSCIPCYFQPITDPETGHMLVDGGALNNFPLAFLTEDEKDFALGITFSEDHVQTESIDNMIQFFERIHACFHLPRTLDIWKRNEDKIIIIPCGHYPMWDFEASSEVKEDMIKKGYEAAAAFIKGFSQGPKRRYSVS